AGAQLRCHYTVPLPPAWTGRRLARGDTCPAYLRDEKARLTLSQKFDTTARGHVRAPARVCLSAGLNRLIIPLRLPLARTARKISWSSRMPRKNGKLAISRRTLLVGAAALGVLPSRRAFSQAQEPLKVGFLTVNTGPLAAGGKQQMEGAAFYLKERGGMIAGRKVELITEDTAGNPALARTKTQELVERYKVPVMIGPLATNEALAIDSYIRDTKVPLITTTSAATVDLKTHAVNPWVLHAF